MGAGRLYPRHAVYAGALLKVGMAFDEAIPAERKRLADEPLFDTEGLRDDDAFWANLKEHIVALFHDYYRRPLAQADVTRVLFGAEGVSGAGLPRHEERPLRRLHRGVLDTAMVKTVAFVLEKG